MSESPKIGVWLCECGGNIGDVVDSDRVIDTLKGEVASIRKERYLCSKPSVDGIKSIVEREKLNRIVLACCTPKMHRETFLSNLIEKGLNPAYVEMVNEIGRAHV